MPRDAPADAIFLVEGTFLHRDELRDFWSCSLFLDVSFDESARRMRARHGNDRLDERLIDRYRGAQRLYFRAARPWDRATIIIDNTDFHRPCIIPGRATSAAQSPR